MSWNHRVVKHVVDDAVHYTIHEVYYDDSGVPVAFSESAVPAFGETHEELTHCLINQLSALTKPVLDATMFGKVTSNDAEKYVTDTAIDILKCSIKKSKE